MDNSSFAPKVIVLIALVFMVACSNTPLPTKPNTIKELQEFKEKDKFTVDDSLLYPGIGNPKMLPILTRKINEAADDFIEVAKSEKPTEEMYQKKIAIGLSRFSGIYIDTEDMDRICHYYEELMDIVGLESSNGQLNDFRYGL